MQKVIQQRWTKHDWEEKAKHGAEKMRIVVDSGVGLLTHSVLRKQIQRAEQDSRNTDDSEKVNLVPGVKKQGGENDRGYSTAGSQRPVPVVVLVFGQRGCIRNQYAPDVKQEVIKHRFVFEIEAKVDFNCPAEKVERKHVEEQVHEIRMDESGADHAPPLIFMVHQIGVEHPGRQHAGVVECGQGYEHRCGTYEQCDLHAVKDSEACVCPYFAQHVCTRLFPNLHVALPIFARHFYFDPQAGTFWNRLGTDASGACPAHGMPLHGRDCFG